MSIYKSAKASANHRRRVRFHSLTKAGGRPLTIERSEWERLPTGGNLVLQRT